MADNITLNFRVEGKRGMQEALQGVHDALGGLEDASTSANVSLEKQGTTFTDVALKAGEFALAHAAMTKAMKTARRALDSNTTAATALRSELVKVTGALSSVSGAASTFSGHARTLGRLFLTRVLPPLTLFLGAKGIAGAIEGLTEFGAGAASVEPVADAFDSLSRRVGTTGRALRMDLREAVRGTVPDIELMKSSVIALNSEAIKSPEVLAEVARHARTLGQSVGMDTADAFNRIVRAIGLMRPQLLKQVGVLVSVDEATRRWAEANDMTASAMSDAQKHAAFLEAVMEELRAATERVGGATDNLQTVLQQNEAAAQNFDQAMRMAVASSEQIRLVNQEWTQFKTGIIELNESILPPLVHALAETVGFMGRMVTHPLVHGGPDSGFAGGFSDAATAVEDYKRRLEELREAERPLPFGGRKIDLDIPFGTGFFPEIPRPELPTEAFVRFGDEMERIRDLQRSMGDVFDASAAHTTALRRAIRDAIDQGWDPLSERVQRLVRQLRALESELPALTTPLLRPDPQFGEMQFPALRAGPGRVSAGPGPQDAVRSVTSALQTLSAQGQLAEGHLQAAADQLRGAGVTSGEVSKILDRFEGSLAGVGASTRDAEGVVIASFGGMIEAARRGSQDMEQVVVSTFTNILQSLSQRGGPLEDALGGFGVPIFGAIGGILGAVLGDGGRDREVPVRVERYGQDAERTLRDSGGGPERVHITVQSPTTGEVLKELEYELGRRRRRDAIVRVPPGTSLGGG